MDEIDVWNARDRVKERNIMARQYLRQSNVHNRNVNTIRTPVLPQNTGNMRMPEPRFVPVPVPAVIPMPEPEKPTPPVNNAVNRRNGFKLPFALRNGIDEEKLIIMALIMLLYREKADFKLILALCYLIM